MKRGASSLAVGVGLAVVVAVMAVTVRSIVNTMRNVEPVRASTPPVSAVVWGDLVFSKPTPLAHWLRARGFSYSAWAHRHPPANRLLKRHQAH